MNKPQVIYPSVWASTEKYPIQRWQLDDEGDWWGERPNPDYAGFYISYAASWKQLIDPVEYTGQDKVKKSWYQIVLMVKSEDDPSEWVWEDRVIIDGEFHLVKVEPKPKGAFCSEDCGCYDES